MKATLSSKRQIVPPTATRRRSTTHRLERHPVSGLPRMVSLTRPARKVTAKEIARLNAELI